MSMEDVHRKVLELSEQKSEASIHIDQLIVAMVDLEEEQFEKILSNLIIRYGFEKSITEVMYPFLEKIGLLWQTQNISPAQEHFISNLIRQKIIVAIDSLPLVSKEAKRTVLFLREKEMHEIGLLFYHYLVRKAGYRTYYLGQNVPHEDLVQIVHLHQPHLLVTSVTTANDLMPVNSYLKQLVKDFPQQKILASGYQLANAGEANENLVVFKNSLELKSPI